MKFKSGYLGACIVVLALLGGVIFGYVGNIDSEPTTERGYRNIADATGLFNASNERLYSDFVPPKNYTGWAPESVTFNGTTTANPYYIITNPGTAYEVNVDLSNHTTGHGVTAGTYQAPFFYNGYNIRLVDLLSANNIDYTQTVNLMINLNSSAYNLYTYEFYPGVDAYRYIPTNWVQVNPTNIGNASDDLTYEVYGQTYHYYNDSSAVPLWTDGMTFIENRPLSTATTPKISVGGVASIAGVAGDSSTVYHPTDIWLEVNSTDGTVICYSQTNSVVTTEFTSTVQDCTLSWGASGVAGDSYLGGVIAGAGVGHGLSYPITQHMDSAFYANTNGIDTLPFPYTNTVTINYSTGAEGSYVKIGDGFQLASGNSTTWENGYENGSFDLVFSSASGLTGTYTYTISGITLTVSNTGISISANGGTAVNYGAWDSYIIRNVARDGLYFVPILNFNNFQSYTTGEPVKIIEYTGGDFTTFSLSGTTPRFSVENTRVWMNQYGAIMNSPTIDPRALFPADSYPVIVLAMKNFTVFGTGITINNTTYSMNGDAIIIGDKEILLRNLSIRWEDNMTYLDTGDGYVELGETTSTTVSFTGAWYFTATIQEGYDYEARSLNWGIGEWGLDYTQFIIVYEGLIIAGIIICHKAKSISFSGLDWVVTIIAGVGGLLIV